MPPGKVFIIIERCGLVTGPATLELLPYLFLYLLDKFQCYWIIYYLFFQDSIITDKVRAVNHYLGKFQSQGNSQSEQLFAI